MIGRDPVVLAVRGPTPHPVQLGPGSPIDGLPGEGRLGVVDTAVGSAGADPRAALKAVGLWPNLESRSVGAESGDSLKDLLSSGGIKAAILYRTDLAGESGLSVWAIFPTPPPSVSASMAATVHSPHAKDFLMFLAGEGQTDLRRSGLEAP